jgi:hypothetical protein
LNVFPDGRRVGGPADRNANWGRGRGTGGTEGGREKRAAGRMQR